MFKKMRRKLTVFYALIMAVFFISLVFGMYKTMQWSLTSEQEREVLLFAEEEANEHVFLFNHMSSFEAEQQNYQEGSGRMYVYAFDMEGNLRNASRPSPQLEASVLDKIAQWDTPDGQVIGISKATHFKWTYNVMMTAKPIMEDGKQIGTVYVGRDVTAVYNGLHKAMLVLVVIAVCALLAAVLIGYLMAGKAIVPLKNAYEQQRQFAADASHELRTPLSIVLSAIEILEEEPEIKTPFVFEILNDMKDEVLKMTNLVGGLLVLVRSEQPGQKIIKETFNLTLAVEQILRKIQPLAKKKEIHIDFINKPIVELHAEPGKIKQLLLILLDNAIKYTPDQGHVEVTLQKDLETNAVKIFVTDTGVGIDAANLQQIFERFYRVDKVRSRVCGGSGLGLSIAREIVNIHNGTIHVDSTIGKGSTFIVELPGF
jgi:signal transduction histidine kinase